jgi:D-alanine-D-alanine ligase
MRVAIVHNAVSDEAPADERDVLVQVEAVRTALGELGHEHHTFPCTLNLAQLRDELSAYTPDVVFNLVEALDGSDRLIGLAPALFERMELPFTGASFAALLLTSDKLLAKERLRTAGLPTPEWRTSLDLRSFAPPYIIKAIGEHGSLGLSDESVVRADDEGHSHRERIAKIEQQLGRPCFAERYVPGREFNLSLLASDSGCQVLPPAEIDFSGLRQGKLPIVGYDAKWSEDSQEYRGTPRTFAFGNNDRRLLELLAKLAQKCWTVFRLSGYARVDFRVGANAAGLDSPQILEINANPCLSPDAGFVAAASRAGIPFAEVVRRILADARPRGSWSVMLE